MDWRCIVFVILGNCFVSIASPPTFSGTPTAELRSNVSTDVTSLLIGITDPENDGFTCSTTSSGPFNAHLDSSTNGYLLTLSHSNPSALTASQYIVTIQCTDDNSETSSYDITVTVSSNGPPTGTLSEIVTVDVSAKYLSNSVLHTLAVTDPDGDHVTCTTTSASANFNVDTNDCTIRNVPDLRSRTLTQSELIEISVNDGVNSAVTFQRILAFTNLNRPPEFSPPLPAVVQKHEDVTASDILMTFSVTDDQSFSRWFSVDTGASLFDFDSNTGDVRLASGQSFDYESGMRTFIIQCVADDSFLQSTSSVTLSIMDVNDPPTLSTTAAAVIVEEGPPNSVSATLSISVAADDDAVTSTSHAYSVVAGGPYSSYFSFPDPHKPVLTNLLELDRDGDPPPPTSLSLEVAVTDPRGASATAKVTVTLTDVNDNDPEFEAASLEMSSVYKDMSAGTVLGQVRATDEDEGLNQELEFSLVTPNAHSGLFGVAADGTVTLLRNLDQTYATTLGLKIEAKDKGSPSQRSSTADVTLAWNKPPVFTNLPNVADVPEDPSVEKLLLTLTTSDPENDVVACSVTDVTPDVTGSSSFVVKTVPGTSDLGVYYNGGEDLDRDVSKSYDVTVTAKDGKGGSTSAVLRVEVTPNTPPDSSCSGADSATVDVQTASMNDEVKALTVTDVDNDALAFVMTSSPNSGSFRFDSGSQKVLVSRDLRKEPVTSHELTISISDNHHDPITCTIFVTLININQAPVFGQHSALVPVDEHVTALTSLFQFDVTDVDSVKMRCEVDPLSGSSYFTFSSDSAYDIKLSSGHSFDYETKPREFIITCTADDGDLQSSSTVTISVSDSNDPPYFQTSSVTTFQDEGPAGTVSFLPSYGQVDPDGDALTYKIVEGGLHSSSFSINSADGTLTNQIVLDRDAGGTTTYTIQVEVKDPSGQTATTAVTINLNDVNDNDPEFSQNSYEYKVGLSTKRGTLLGTLEITDIDDGVNSEIDLAITNQSPSGYMTLEQDGRLYLTRDLDGVEYGTLFTVDVKATDRGDPKRSSTVIVNVVWNEGPKIENLPDTVSVAETIEGKQSVYELDVVDLESDQYTCNAKSITPSTTLFSVLETSSKKFEVLFMGSDKLNSDTNPKYTMTVHCSDANGEVSKVLTILVLPNTAPLLPCSPTASVTVDAMATEADMTVYTVLANDAENDLLRFSTSSSQFYISESTGAIKAKEALATVTSDEYSVPITVRDEKNSAECTVLILLTNINKKPYFDNLDYTVDLAEDKVGGDSVYEITVTDPNIRGDNIEVTRVSYNKQMFDLSVSKNVIMVKVAPGVELDYETQQNLPMTLTFEVSDGYLTSEEGTLTVHVTNVNEPPYFRNGDLFVGTFKEYLEDSQQVETLNCDLVDPDEDDEVTLTLSGPSADLFTITDPDNCQLTLTSEYDIDAGAPEVLTLTITATDKLGESVDATVMVTIEPVNDNTPEFDGPIVLTAYYGMVAGETVGKVEATDKDILEDGVLSYQIVEEPLNSDLANQYITFSSTGEFHLRQSMDNFVSSENFQYIVQTTDHGEPARTATTTVNIVYDPTPTTTPDTNLTTTSAANAPEEDSSLLDEPLVIGLLVALGLIGALLMALLVALCCNYFGLCPSSLANCCRCCQSRPVSANSLYPSRPNTPVRTNKISVVSMDGHSSGPHTYLTPPATTAYEGRKISALLPPPHY